MDDKKGQEGKKCGILPHFALCRMVVHSGRLSLLTLPPFGPPPQQVVGNRPPLELVATTTALLSVGLWE
jgi:hypothetical protein